MAMSLFASMFNVKSAVDVGRLPYAASFQVYMLYATAMCVCSCLVISNM